MAEGLGQANVGGGQSARDVAVLEASPEERVVRQLLVDAGGARGERGLGVGDDGQRLVGQADHIERVFGPVRVGRDHGHHRLAGEADLAARQRWPVRRLVAGTAHRGPDGPRRREIGGGDHGFDAR